MVTGTTTPLLPFMCVCALVDGGVGGISCLLLWWLVPLLCSLVFAGF